MPQYHKHSLHNLCKQSQQPDFHFKISGFLAAIKLTDKSGYLDNGYPDMQTLVTVMFYIEIRNSTYYDVLRIFNTFSLHIIAYHTVFCIQQNTQTDLLWTRAVVPV